MEFQDSSFSPLGSNSSLYGNSFTFTGRRLDQFDDLDLELMYYRARYYQSGIGSFWSRDVLEYTDGMNAYQYGASFPVASVDPAGRVVIWVVIGGTIIVYVLVQIVYPCVVRPAWRAIFRIARSAGACQAAASSLGTGFARGRCSGSITTIGGGTTYLWSCGSGTPTVVWRDSGGIHTANCTQMIQPCLIRGC